MIVLCLLFDVRYDIFGSMVKGIIVDEKK